MNSAIASDALAVKQLTVQYWQW